MVEVLQDRGTHLYLHVLFYTLGQVRTTPYKQIQTGTYYRSYYRYPQALAKK